ncbi:MAG: response regulator [Thermodesulfobacteriota bacterium]|nr:MAG: response regulator [Thermodesulfobacteriota bacterium]
MAINFLIVDDSSVMRSMIAKALQMSGIDLGAIHQAGNGKEGLDKLDEHVVDLAIVDITMPVMNGEEMIDCMRSRSDTNQIPVIVISNEGSEARIERLKEKKAWFIHKPFTPERIRDVINELVGRQNA